MRRDDLWSTSRGIRALAADRTWSLIVGGRTSRLDSRKGAASVRNYVCRPPLAEPLPASMSMPLYRGTR